MIVNIYIKMDYTYVLKLQQRKYYIGRTCNLANRIYSHVCVSQGLVDFHYLYSKSGSMWTMRYELRKIVGIYGGQNNNKFENIMIMEYMKRYGIHNVREGRYCRLKLSKKALKEIKTYL